MCNNNEFYFCEHCGNLIDMIHNAGVSVLCCGQKMKRIEPGALEASQEKHLPVVSVSGNTVTVNVGSVEHPMTEEQKDIFQKFHDCWDEYVSLAEAAIFEYAFRLGARLTIQVQTDEE